MIEKGIHNLTATRLRVMLSASLVGILVIIGIGFYFLQSYLYSFAVEVSHANEDASTSGSDIATLQKLQQEFKNDQTTIQRVESIVAESKSYEYQDQIIADLNTYANRSGVKITSFTFDAGTPSKTGATVSTTPASPSVAVAGLKSTGVSITLEAPTKYNSLMKFIHSIEQNLTKMQLASLSLTKGTASDEVSISALQLEVYIK
jgi:hypothetical protein